MLKLVGGLVKATVAVALTPVAVVADIALMPVDAHNNEDMLHRTAGLLKAAEQNVADAVKPEKE